MIQANELRIGDWIADRGGKEWQIESWECSNKVSAKEPEFNLPSFSFRVHPMTEYVDYLQPIPITEEWLKKLGFVYDDMSDTDDDNTWYHLDIGTVKFHSDKSCNFESVYCGVNMTKLEFKNVHKFQNFVFDLTGKELEFKL